MALAFPFSIPRAVSGADFPFKPRSRRIANAPVLEPLLFAKMVAARVEAVRRNDWRLVPSARNRGTKCKALWGGDAACRHFVDTEKPGVEMAAEISEAAGALYEKLEKGFWWDGRKRREIDRDATKLQYALHLTPMEANLVKDLCFVSSTCAGTQQIRLEIGHAMFGARVEFGDPMFITVSPSSRHSGLCVRFSRYRSCDPAILHERPGRPGVKPWHASDRPSIWGNEVGTESILDLPDYDVRKLIAARGPWSVMLSFGYYVKYLLPRRVSLSMCTDCPHCNQCDHLAGCQNSFGHRMLPTGGNAGMALAMGGCVEYQLNDNPHIHGSRHLSTAYQYRTIIELAALMQDSLISLDDVAEFQACACREEHFGLEAHEEALPHVEASWRRHSSGTKCSALCSLPAYIKQDGFASLWSRTHRLAPVHAAEDARTFKQRYHADAQFVIAHCHHNWHPANPRTQKREPIRGCRAKTGQLCKAMFPMSQRLNSNSKVICPGNCRKHDLRVAGRSPLAA